LYICVVKKSLERMRLTHSGRIFFNGRVGFLLGQWGGSGVQDAQEEQFEATREWIYPIVRVRPVVFLRLAMRTLSTEF
jgi:hypothetical protein